ncbi:MAG: hypothetical protein QOG23_5554 [Blastocatellia bacterium]|nr:hypothetical protein [Blastocatellia bacterium]
MPTLPQTACPVLATEAANARDRGLIALGEHEEARHQLGGISHSTFYALIKEGELSLVKIGSRSFVQAEELDEFLRRKRCEGRMPS